MTGITLLALETATEHCSVALWQRDDQGQVRVVARRQHAPRQQTELILPMVDDVLSESGIGLNQLTSIAYSCGPGAFTGVRIAAAVAQGLALGADLPVVAVGSLQTLAQATYRQYGAHLALPAFDARMQEIYAGAYAVDAAGLMQPLTGDVAGAANQLPEAFLQCWQSALVSRSGLAVAAGSGWATYGDTLATVLPVQHQYPAIAPDAEDVALLASVSVEAGQAVAPELALPVYLRNDVWKKLPGR